MKRFLTCGLCACLIALSAASLASAQDTSTTTTTTAPSTTTTTTNPGPQVTQGGGGNVTDQSTFTSQALAVPTITLSAMQSSAGSTTTIPSNANVFGTNYIDPLSVGMASKFTGTMGTAKPTGTFGVPLYGAKTTTTAPKTTTTTSTAQTPGFSSAGIVRAPVYSTVLSDELPPIVHVTGAVQSNIRAAIERSSMLSNKASIEVLVNGNVVELRGQVADAREFRIAEGLASTTPGVVSVVNLLQIVKTK